MFLDFTNADRDAKARIKAVTAKRLVVNDFRYTAQFEGNFVSYTLGLKTFTAAVVNGSVRSGIDVSFNGADKCSADGLYVYSSRIGTHTIGFMVSPKLQVVKKSTASVSIVNYSGPQLGDVERRVLICTLGVAEAAAEFWYNK